MPANKVVSLEEAIGRVHDGDVVALQNMATQAAPMAAVRELIRQEQAQPRTGRAWSAGSPSTGWRRPVCSTGLIGAAVSMEQFGLCQQYRKAVEAGRIRVEELSARPRSTPGSAPARATCRSCRPAG